MSPSATCEQDFPQALAHSVVAHSELTQVTDLLAMFAGVPSTTPASGLTWFTLITAPSSATGLVVSRVVTTPVPNERLTHTLGGSAAPSRHISAVPAVTAALPEPPKHGLSGNNVDNLDEIKEDLDDSLMLEGRDVQALFSATSTIAPDEPATNARKRSNQKRTRITKHDRKLAVAKTLAFSRPDPKP